MMVVRVEERRWLVSVIACALALGSACKRDGGGTTPEGSASAGGSGGETAAGEDGAIEDQDWDGDGKPDSSQPGEEGTSQWGATRAEQCRQNPRPEMKSSAQGPFRDGVRAAGAGDVAGARRLFQQALSADPKAYQAAYNLGVLADRSGQESKAIEQYQNTLRIQSDYAPAAKGIVTIHLRRGQVSRAVSFVEPVARKHGNNLAIQALAAEVMVQAERFDDAWTLARKALKCDERYVPALIALVKASRKQGRKELAESILDQALGMQGNNAELHFLKGMMLRDEPGRLRDSMKEFRRAVELRPSYAEARMALGVQLLAGGNYNEAVAQFEAAVRLTPTVTAVHLNLADAYRANKQWAKAKASFDRVLRSKPDLPQAHFNLGLMYLTAKGDFPGLDELGALKKAVEEFTKYRNVMGPRLPRDDQSEEYLRDLKRQIERTERRIERDKARKKRAAERGARGEASQ